MASYIFGGSTGETLESLKMKRALAAQLASAIRTPRNVGEGLSAIGNAIGYRAMMKGIAAGEAARRKAGNEAFGSIVDAFRGGAPAPVSTGTADGIDAFNASLAKTESGGNYNARNSLGFTGKYQFGQPRLDDYNRAAGTSFTTDQLLKSPELQERVQRWHVGDIDRFIVANGLNKYIGQTVNGVPMTQNGLRAMAHLGGVHGMSKFLESGGKYNPADANGTSLVDYARRHAGAAAPQSAAQPTQGAGIDLGTLVTALASPDLSPEQRQIGQALLMQRLQLQAAQSDPAAAQKAELARLNIEKARKDLAERKTLQGADGFTYYQDTGERVLPNVAAKPDAPTTDIQEYKFAQSQGYTGSFTDFQTAKRKAGATSIVNNNGSQSEIGTIPQGFELFTDPNTGARSMRPIVGGPAAIEADKIAKTKEVAKASTARSGNVVIEDIDRALDGLNKGNLPTAGMIGGQLSGIPGTQAYDVAQLIETIKANSGFDRLQAMRDSSPTGGALGAINQSEMSLLQAALGNLSQSQSMDQLVFNLKRVRRIYDEIINGTNAGRKPDTLPDGRRRTMTYDPATGELK